MRKPPATMAARGLVVAGLFFSALALAYPEKPVTWIVPFPPGGGTDISARTVAAKLTEKWKQSVVIENRAGAAGIIGADAVAKARPDGYTLLIVNVGITSINPDLYPKLPYNPDTAFTPISLLCELPFVLMASPSFRPNSTKELVAYAKANPGKVTFASSGQGGSPHLTAEIFQLATGTQLTHVPYKGGGPAMTDLLGGHVPVLFASMATAVPHVRSGKIKGLGVTTPARVPAIPDVPTVAELGCAGYEARIWFGIVGPAKLPPEITAAVSRALVGALEDKSVQDAIRNLGYEPVPNTPAQFATVIRDDLEKWRRVVAEAKIKVD